jgi:maltokinase
VTVTFDDGTLDTYQLPIAYLPTADETLEHALIGPVDEPELGRAVAYDGAFSKETVAALYDGFLTATRTGADQSEPTALEFHTVDAIELADLAQDGAVMTAEQSNTSIAYGEEAILKLYRRISAGFNPDIEIHEALSRKGDDHVAPLLGWIDGSWTDAEGERHRGHLGMLQEFLRTASDGWDLARASVRDLLVEEDLRADEVGGDFAAEAERLGAATASVHADLAELFPTSSSTPAQLAELAATVA